jgi:hypothetical protein
MTRQTNPSLSEAVERVRREHDLRSHLSADDMFLIRLGDLRIILQSLSVDEEVIARAIWDAQYPKGTSWDDWARHMEENPDSFDGRYESRRLARAVLDTLGMAK